jgi:cytochrome c-type biogenesis protein CcmH
MGWAIPILVALAALAAIGRFGRLDRTGLQLVAAALLLALAGYAWQGRPGLAGSPRAAAARPPAPQTPFFAFRRELFGAFDAADYWLIIAESRLRSGDTQGAAGVIRSGLRARPGNATLWTGYGDALVLHGEGALTPAAELAFRKAMALAPKHPGPPLFYGIALAQNGRFEEAELRWRQALALTPPKAPWREGLEEQIARVEEARAAPR